MTTTSTSVPGFLTKTYEIFSNPEYADCCGWGPTGETIIIRKVFDTFHLLSRIIILIIHSMYIYMYLIFLDRSFF